MKGMTSDKYKKKCAAQEADDGRNESEEGWNFARILMYRLH